MTSRLFFFFLFFLIMALFGCNKKITVDAVKMVKGPVESTVTTINSGTVEAQRQAALAFGSVGRIARIYVSLGSKVDNQQMIAELENADLKAIYNETKKEAERAAELFKNGLVSNSNLDSANRALEVARINYEKTLMKAPFAGLITAMELKPGEFYQNATSLDNKPLVQIIDLKKRLIKGEIDEVDLQKVKIGNEARIKIPALKNRVFKATVTKVVPFVSTAKDQDRTSQIELEVTEDIKEELIPVGASADVEIVSEHKTDVYTLPANIFMGTGKTRSVFKIEKNKLTKTPVKIGVGNYERLEVLEGVSPGDLIARPLEGAELQDGMKVEYKETKWP